MAIWISWNLDIPRNLNSRDSFPRREFENRAQRCCRSGPMLLLTTIRFELHAKIAEIDIEKCNFRNFTSSWPWLWMRSRSHLCSYLVNIYRCTKLAQNRKPFVDVRTYRRTHATSNSRLGHRIGYDLKMVNTGQFTTKCRPRQRATEP